MQEDFHYYATYCAAYIAGFSHDESLKIAYCSQFVDCCSKSLLTKLKAPEKAATTQLQLEMMDIRITPLSLQDITRIWASFHFLPYDLNAPVKRKPKIYKDIYRLICNPNGSLVVDTIKLAKDKSLPAAGIAMHVLADTWAHRYFAGTPSLVINNTNYHFYEILPDKERHIDFRHNPLAPDDIENGKYTGSLYQSSEHSIMNLGHGRAGHFPDYSFAKYRYLPAWNGYKEVIKDNPTEYYLAFCQMVYALQYLKGTVPDFETEKYAFEVVDKYKDSINGILTKRVLIASDDWKQFGETLSGKEIEPFDIDKYQAEYMEKTAEQKEDTLLGQFFSAAIDHKSMVTNRIFSSGNLLAGFSITKKIPRLTVRAGKRTGKNK